MAVLLLLAIFSSPRVLGFTLSATTPNSNGTFTLSWTQPSNGNSSYAVNEYDVANNKEIVHAWTTNRNVTLTRSGGRYYFFVVAVGRAPEVRTSEVPVLVPIPKPPQVTSATLGNSEGNYDTNGRIDLSWGAVAHAKEYQIYYGKRGGAKSWITVSGLSRPFTGLSDGIWEFQVRGNNIGDDGVYREHGDLSIVWSKEVMITPGTPPGLTSNESKSFDGSFRISWKASSNRVTRYEWRERVNGDSWSSFASTGTTRHLDRSKPDGTYNFQVRACNEGSCSGTSSVTVEVIKDRSPGITLIGVSNQDGWLTSTGKFEIDWDGGSVSGIVEPQSVTLAHTRPGATSPSVTELRKAIDYSHTIERQPNPYPFWVFSQGTHTFVITSCVQQQVTGGTWQNIACLQSEPVALLFDAPEPETVNSLVASRNQENPGIVTLDWSDVGFANYYRVLYGREGSFSHEARVQAENLNVNAESTITITFSESSDNGDWNFKVIACNRFDECSLNYSPIASVTVDLHVPEGCSGVAVSSSPVSSAYHYDALGRLILVEDSANCNRSYQFDPAGNRIEVKEHNQ